MNLQQTMQKGMRYVLFDGACENWMYNHILLIGLDKAVGVEDGFTLGQANNNNLKTEGIFRHIELTM